MKFGPRPTAAALDAILAHSLRLPDRVLKKGHRLGRDDLAAAEAQGLATLVVAEPGPGDVHEDEAAARVGAAVKGAGVRVKKPFTGRCNLYAARDGVLQLDEHAITWLNRIDPAVTVATLAAFARVVRGQMLATVKIIPFAVPGAVLGKALEAAQSPGGLPGGLLTVCPYRPRRVGLIQTRLSATKDTLLDKTEKVIAGRLAAYGLTLEESGHCDHGVDALAVAIRARQCSGLDLIMVVGASAIVDRRDVIPAAFGAAGGEVLHFGMPVDPGNLLLLARLGEVDLLGLPGCARSPKFNGLDKVLDRIVAGIPVSGNDITAMGVGGLLQEMPGRPQPRDDKRADKLPVPRPKPRVAALVMAAGQSVRMGPVNKLLLDVRGKPMVAGVVEQVAASRCAPVIVVLGHESAKVKAALRGFEVTFVHNPRYRQGLSTSLQAGLHSLVDEAPDGVLVCLGDMPEVTSAHINALVRAFEPQRGSAICVPVFRGKRGNPVLFGRQFFPALEAVQGDVGGRHLIGEQAEWVTEVAIETPGVVVDVDSPETLARVQGYSASHEC